MFFFSNPSSRFVNKVDAPSTRPATPNLLKKRDVGFKKMRRYVVPAWAAHMVPTWVAHMVPTWAAHIPGVPEKSRLKQISLNFLSHVRYF